MSASEQIPNRRIPRSAALRRLICAGNLLASGARGEITATTDLADIWDSAVEELRADLEDERCAHDRANQFLGST